MAEAKKRLPTNETLLRIINSDPGARALYARFIQLEWDTTEICTWLRETRDRDGVTLAEYVERLEFRHVLNSTY